MRQNEIPLQGTYLIARDARAREQTESGVQAVDGRAARHQAPHRRGAGAHPLQISAAEVHVHPLLQRMPQDRQIKRR